MTSEEFFKALNFWLESELFPTIKTKIVEGIVPFIEELLENKTPVESFERVACNNCGTVSLFDLFWKNGCPICKGNTFRGLKIGPSELETNEKGAPSPKTFDRVLCAKCKAIYPFGTFWKKGCSVCQEFDFIPLVKVPSPLGTKTSMRKAQLYSCEKCGCVSSIGAYERGDHHCPHCGYKNLVLRDIF